MERTKTYITKKLIDDISFSEIDFDLHSEFDFDYETDSEFIEIQIGQGISDGYPINIDNMIKALEDLKKKGSTHVEINYHCDHIGYEISGYEIKRSNEEEISSYEEKRSKERQKREKISELYNQIKKINNS